MEGAETIARSLSRYATFEQIYFGCGKSTTRALTGLEEALVKLYAVILVYLGRAKHYFEEHTPSGSYSHLRSSVVADWVHRTHGKSRHNLSK